MILQRTHIQMNWIYPKGPKNITNKDDV